MKKLQEGATAGFEECKEPGEILSSEKYIGARSWMTLLATAGTLVSERKWRPIERF